MAKISLPKTLDFACPRCRGAFAIPSVELAGRRELTCPYCADRFLVYYGLSGKVRRQIYHVVRDELEQRVYEHKLMERPSYFEDLANLPREDGDETSDKQKISS
ncbi:hypothetical protein IIA79_08095 [bacterium]|nr:hypothetical protein [bacterium]